MRASPASRMASSMVAGMPRPMPDAVRPTNRDSVRASGRALHLVDRVRAALADGDGLLADGDDVAGGELRRRASASVSPSSKRVAAHEQPRADRCTCVVATVDRRPREQVPLVVRRRTARARPQLARCAPRATSSPTRVKCEPGAAPSREPPSWSKNTRIQISVLIARQKICDGSTSPAQNRSNVSASAGGVPVRPRAELRRAEQALHRGASGPQPAGLGRGEPDLPAPGAHLLGEHALQAVAEDGPAPARRRRCADDGSRNTQSTSSWSRNGRRDSIENAIELRSS